MKKRETERLAVRVLTYLSQLPDGAELSTYEAVKQIYEVSQQETKPDAIEFEDWFAIHEHIWGKAGMYGLELDDSKYHDQVVGLPQHIPFVVTHR